MAFAVIGTLLAGCAGPKGLGAAMDSWKGAPLSEVTAQWGAPTSSTPFQEKTIYTWTRIKRVVAAKASSAPMLLGVPHAGAVNVAVTEQDCTRRFLVDQAGLVVEGDWSGSNCPIWAAEGLVRGAPEISDRP